ncbi:MAG: glycosyltransferase family 4 protein [bacterium]|nr:glycosyltransferase family 4 protein [bacterium]
MKILSLGLDNSVLDKKSSLAQRTIEYGNLVERYTVIVPCRENKEVVLSERAWAVGVGSQNKVIALFKIFKTAKRLLNKEKYNIITVQDQYYLALLGWLLAKKFSIGLEIQIHGFEKYYWLRKVIAKYILPRAGAVRVVSQRLKKRLVEEFGVNAEKITVVPIYTRIKNYELRIMNNRLKNNNFIFLTVGRLVPIKNIEMQIRAMKELKVKSEKLKVELWIVGIGEKSKELKVKSEKLGIGESVKLLGWKSKEELEKIYEQADIFLLTSDSEGWGMAVIEAASCGLPIIMTDVGCAGEVIKGFEHAATIGVHANDLNNVSGIVIPVGDQGKLEENMIKLIEDKELRRKLGENARQAVLTLPNKEETLKLYKKSWENAVKNKS